MGWTSHDVVARVRRLSGERRVGHAGTLDPLAEGVLPVLLGRATRLADFVGQGRKRYTATVALGIATTTDDREGEVVETAPLPTVLTADDLEHTLERFRGVVSQVPPAFSAIQVDGQRAYAAARRGQPLELAAREVTIYGLDVLEVSHERLVLDVRCSRGTYIRSLARDLGRALGTAAHLAGLVRTEVGPFALEGALTVDEIQRRGVAACLLPADAGLPDAPTYHAARQQAGDLALGRAVPWDGPAAPLVRVYDASGQMLCVGTSDGSSLRSRILLQEPVG